MNKSDLFINYSNHFNALQSQILEIIRIFIYSYLLYLVIMIYQIDISFKFCWLSIVIGSIVGYFFIFLRIRFIWLVILNISLFFIIDTAAYYIIKLFQTNELSTEYDFMYTFFNFDFTIMAFLWLFSFCCTFLYFRWRYFIYIEWTLTIYLLVQIFIPHVNYGLNKFSHILDYKNLVWYVLIMPLNWVFWWVIQHNLFKSTK